LAYEEAVKVMVSKKVCLVTWGHDPLDDRIFFKEALSLGKVYHQVTILTTGPRKIQQVGVIKVVAVERTRFFPWTMWRLCLAARGERAHFYHLHEPQLLPLALFLRLLYRVKIIYDVHEHLPEMIRDFSTRSRKVAALLAAIFSQVDLTLARCADAVLVTTGLLASRYARIDRRVAVIYNYPRTDLFNGMRTPPVALRQKYASSRIVLYHGQIGRMRNIPLLIEAIKLAAQRVGDLKLLLLGPVFGNSYRAQLLKLLRDEQVYDLVELLDPVPHQQVPDYIALSQVGLVILPPMSVFTKNIPIKLFEYMACGVPVVGSRLPPIEKFVRRANCGLLVDPTDSREIATAIMHLLEHPEEAKAMGLRGQAAVKEAYNWSRMEARLLTLFQELGEGSC
jgi:glycosyltransferase involved in cell wall biosynthesis